MAASIGTCRRYLFQFAHEHVDFRLSELKSVASLLGVPLDISNDWDSDSPYLMVDLPSEECARKLVSRTVLVKSLYELWGHGHDPQEVYRNTNQLPSHFKEKYTGQDQSFRIMVETFNKNISLEEKISKIERLLDGPVDFKGPINLKQPQHSFHWLEYYGPKATSQPEPFYIYFGRWLADGQRDLIMSYHLTKRKFIGNTSMDAALSLVMANMGGACKNRLVFDPFVGTGSLLVACAHYGAYVAGTDIDYNILHGKGKSSRHNEKWRGPDENIQANLRQYGLGHLYLDAVVADASKHIWREQPLFDAIITDPPYGVREPTTRVGSKKNKPMVSEEHKDGHIPSKVNYELSDILVDLLNFAAKFLTVMGRLVYWLPVDREKYVEENIPRHPCLALVNNCEQPLNTRLSRRLIVMQKTRDWQADDEQNSAQFITDHYKDTSFREQYFSKAESRRPKKMRRKRKVSTKDTPSLDDSESVSGDDAAHRNGDGDGDVGPASAESSTNRCSEGSLLGPEQHSAAVNPECSEEIGTDFSPHVSEGRSSSSVAGVESTTADGCGQHSPVDAT